MKTMLRSITSAGIIAAALAAAPSYAMVSAFDLGTAVNNPVAATRVVSIDSGTKWANVRYGETVRFVVKGTGGEQSFAHRFDGSGTNLHLSDIEHSSGPSSSVAIYVDQSDNPNSWW